MKEIEISVITENDLDTYKTLRLRSLQDTPDAFGSTYGRECVFTEDDWKSRITPSESTLHLLPLIAKYKGIPAGVISGVVQRQDANSAHIYQMWVDPHYRENGIAKALIKQLLTWADGLGLDSLLLAVTTTNLAAVSLYKTIGFVNTDETEALREGSELVVQSMKLNLSKFNAIS